jgi:hypothetical protein
MKTKRFEETMRLEDVRYKHHQEKKSNNLQGVFFPNPFHGN